MILSLLLSAVLALADSGQAEAIITGPTSGLIGELIILDGSKSINVKNYRWKVDKNIEKRNYLEIDNGKKVVFSGGIQGKYNFTLIVSDKTGNISFTETEIFIGVMENVEKQQKTIKNLPTIEELSLEWFQNVTSSNKIDEVHKVSGVLKSVANLIKTTNISKESEVIAATRSMLQTELGIAFTNWNTWINALQSYCAANKLRDVEEYRVLWLKISESLGAYQ